MKNTKMLVALMSLLCCLLCMYSSPVYAETSGYCGNNLTWTLAEGVLTIQGNGSMYDYSQKEIPWYNDMDKIRCVKISDGVVSIGENAFNNCSFIYEIQIPKSVTTIKEKAFTGCDSLSEIIIPDSVIDIGEQAFSYCSALRVATLPKHIKKIPAGMFFSCYELISVTIPVGVTEIGYGAFQDCFSLSNVSIPESVTTIGTGAFNQCGSLLTLSIPDSVTSIGNNAFKIKDSHTQIGWVKGKDYYIYNDLTLLVGKNSYAEEYCKTNDCLYAYSGEKYPCGDNLTFTFSEHGVLTVSGNGPMENYCKTGSSYDHRTNQPWEAWRNSISTVILEEGITSIGEYAFYYFENLSRVIIPETVTSIADYGIGDNTKGTCIVTIPDSVVSISEHAISAYVFINSGGYLEERFKALGERYILQDTDYSYGESIKYSLSDNGVLIISGSGSINSSRDSSSDAPWKKWKKVIKSVVIQDGISSIENEAFYEYEALSSVTIPNSVTKIGDRAFSGCTSLISVEIPSSVTSIGVTIFERCPNLPLHPDVNGFIIIGRFLYLYTGSESVVSIPNGIERIGGGAFRGSNVTEVTIPDSILSIGPSAFQMCAFLTDITIPNSVTSIGDDAFYYCQNLTNVTISDSVTSIGSQAFGYCENLASVTISKSVTYIDPSAFDGRKETVFIVDQGSYAEEYCIQQGKNYQYR